MALFRHIPSDGIQVAWSIHSNCNGRFLNASSKYETSGPDTRNVRTGALIVRCICNWGYSSFGLLQIDNWPGWTILLRLPADLLPAAALAAWCSSAQSSQVLGLTGNSTGLISVGQPMGEFDTRISSAESDCRSSSSAPRSTSRANSVIKSHFSAETIPKYETPA
jgi:hypothetical protein